MSVIAGTMGEAHYMCSRPDYEPVSTHADLNRYLMSSQVKAMTNMNWVTSWSLYHAATSKGRRYGQAFMNSIPEEDYLRLTGTLIDPFHSDNRRDILIALDYLLFSKEN